MNDNGKRSGGSWQRLAEAVVLSNPAFAAPEGGHVLVASEDETRRRRIMAALSRDGHRVTEARAALELMRLAGIAGPSLRHPTRPDAIVLDVTGKRWATLDMLEVVCSEHWTLPVLALVDKGDPEAEAEARRLGAAAVLELPVDEDSVRAEVMTIVDPSPSCRGAA
jgi:DNA-binding response OmpR family regulator